MPAQPHSPSSNCWQGAHTDISAIVLHRVDDSRNMRRFYRLDFEPDLFGVWLFICEWGRIGRSGQTRIASFATLEEAHITLERQRRAKQRRGYLEI